MAQQFVGHGDVDSPQKAAQMRALYPAISGIMIGRGSIGNPWIFREIKHHLATGELLPPPTLEERVATARRHFTFGLEWKGEKKGVWEMRRHWGPYFRGMPHFKPWRMRLVTEEDPATVLAILDEIATHEPFLEATEHQIAYALQQQPEAVTEAHWM